MDPRINIINERLAGIKRILAISGGKGGIGKSTFAVGLALALSKKGKKIGLLDLDFWGPSVHVLLGAQGAVPEEERGIVPPQIHGIACMSVAYYTLSKALALRKSGFENAVIELLAVTRWGSLDYLIMDMPPGIGDVVLDVLRLMKKVEFCIITTHAQLVLETVKKTLSILKELNIPVVGVVQNMGTKNYSVKKEINIFNVPLLGKLRFEAGLESAIGNPDIFLKTDFIKAINRSMVKKIEQHFHFIGRR